MRRWSIPAALGVPLVLVAAVALSACGEAKKVAAPNARDRALLTSVLAGMKTDLASVRIGNPTSEWGRDWSGRRFLYVTPASTSTIGKIEDGWYATLIAGAYQAQCGRQTADCLIGYETQGIGGSRLGGAGTHLAPVSRLTLLREIRSRFAKAGLNVSSISFERPLGLAPVITVKSGRPQRDASAFYRADLFRHLPIEGFLVRMIDAHGTTFLIDGGSFRTKEGSGWVRPGIKLRNVPEKTVP